MQFFFYIIEMYVNMIVNQKETIKRQYMFEFQLIKDKAIYFKSKQSVMILSSCFFLIFKEFFISIDKKPKYRNSLVCVNI